MRDSICELLALLMFVIGMLVGGFVLYILGGEQQDRICEYTVTSEGYGQGEFTLVLDSEECDELIINIDENYFRDINYTLEGGH